jgi:hypothetical protein
MSTDKKVGLQYCETLFAALKGKLSDISYVQGIDSSLKAMGLAPTFPEVRFCKGCVLPIVDEATNTFLSNRFEASKDDIRSALRCEGFQTLPQYYKSNDRMSGYIGSPRNRDRTVPSKSGDHQHTGANPDFCVRFSGAGSLHVVGEVKYLPNRLTSAASVQQVKRELLHYLSIKSSSHSDWFHDTGSGIMYCGKGDTDRMVGLILDYWESDQIAIAYFHA